MDAKRVLRVWWEVAKWVEGVCLLRYVSKVGACMSGVFYLWVVGGKWHVV